MFDIIFTCEQALNSQTMIAVKTLQKYTENGLQKLQINKNKYNIN